MNIRIEILADTADPMLPPLLFVLRQITEGPVQAPSTGDALAVPGGTVAPVKRGPGRPPKSAAAPIAEPAAPAPAAPAVAVPVAAPAAEAAPAAPAGPKLTMKDLTTMVTETLDAVGQNPVRAVFKQFNAGKLSDVPPEKFTAFAAALTEARSMVQ